MEHKKITLNVLCVVADKVNSNFCRVIYKHNFPHRIAFSTGALGAFETFNQVLETERSFDLVLIDYGLYDMDGITLAEILKEKDPYVNLILFPSIHLLYPDIIARVQRLNLFMLEPTFFELDYADIFKKAEDLKLLKLELQRKKEQ